MTREAKIWATRRARYGASGGRTTPIKLHWIPAEMRGRYNSLRSMHGVSLAQEIIRMEIADASA